MTIMHSERCDEILRLIDEVLPPLPFSQPTIDDLRLMSAVVDDPRRDTHEA